MEITTELISYCGLYCGACSSYKKAKCPGCAKNHKASWCKVRTCNIQKEIADCSECDEYEDVYECKKFNNFFSKAIGLVLNSDRRKGILYIKSKGRQAFAEHLFQMDRVSLKRRE